MSPPIANVPLAFTSGVVVLVVIVLSMQLGVVEIHIAEANR
jgi:hypothetical protein